MAGIVERDAMLAQFATSVGRMEGVPLTDWDVRIEELRKTAALGVGDWNPVMSEAISSTAQEIALNKSTRGVDMSKLDDVAMIIASSNSLIAKIFPSKDGEYIRSLAVESEGARRIRYIGSLLRERAENAAIRLFKRDSDKK